jgi:HK97 gp10 family phage protein
MTAGTFEVKGLRELGEALQAFPLKFERNVLRAALRRGAKVMADAMDVPTGEPSSTAKEHGGFPGAMKESLRVSVRLRRGQLTARVRVGGKVRGADVYYAHMVEGGTKPHRIVPRTAKRLMIGGVLVDAVQHPGFEGRHFMRNAFRQTNGAAIDEVARYMEQRLRRGGWKSPDIEG